jgi:CDP-diacylglycerol---serine O-phosphatidyltransferase
MSNELDDDQDKPSLEAFKDDSDEVTPLEDFLPIDEMVEEVSEGGKKVRRKGIYLLPNLFTSAALFAGFFAIIAAINGDFAAAGLAIFFGQLLDGLDGRVARMTNTQSRFGQEFDSLSDMVTFGLVPAIIVFMWCLSDLGKLGWAVAFLYVASAAIRLARFNAAADTADNRYFSGLASPPAATLVASAVWLGYDLGYTTTSLPFVLVITMAFLTAVVSFLMIANVRYHSFKGINFSRRVSVAALLLFILLIGLIATDPPKVLFLLACSYAFSGPMASLWRRLNSKR